MKLTSSENFGFVPPTGSVKNYTKTNLNEGSGKPCAGQFKAIEDSDLNFKMVPVPMVENFGFAPPMGSIKVVLKLT